MFAVLHLNHYIHFLDYHIACDLYDLNHYQDDYNSGDKVARAESLVAVSDRKVTKTAAADRTCHCRITYQIYYGKRKTADKSRHGFGKEHFVYQLPVRWAHGLGSLQDTGIHFFQCWFYDSCNEGSRRNWKGNYSSLCTYACTHNHPWKRNENDQKNDERKRSENVHYSGKYIIENRRRNDSSWLLFPRDVKENAYGKAQHQRENRWEENHDQCFSRCFHNLTNQLCIHQTSPSTLTPYFLSISTAALTLFSSGPISTTMTPISSPETSWTPAALILNVAPVSIDTLLMIGESVVFPLKRSVKRPSSSDQRTMESLTLVRLEMKSFVTSLFGFAKISETVPSSTMRPLSMTATLSQASRTTSIWCVIITTVRFIFACSSFMRARMDLVVWGSRALVASSQKRMSGLHARARAIATLCFWPPESVDIGALPLPWSPTRERSSSTLFDIWLLSIPQISIGYAILPAALRDEKRLKFWKIIPILLLLWIRAFPSRLSTLSSS